MLAPRDTHDVANEFYAKGFTATREEALAIVDECPHEVEFLLSLDKTDREMRHRDDRADPTEWGGVG